MRRRASELLGESRPAVLGVPGDEGAENRQRDGEPGEQRRRGEPAPQRRSGRQREADAGAEKDGGELRLQRQPSASPIATSQRASPVRQSSTRAARPRVQNSTSGASGVTKTAPMRTSGIAIHISAASAVFSAEPNRRHAISAMRAGIAPTKRRESARTPISESPNSAVEARMRRATIGGWSRYPKESARDQYV